MSRALPGPWHRIGKDSQAKAINMDLKDNRHLYIVIEIGVCIHVLKVFIQI